MRVLSHHGWFHGVSFLDTPERRKPYILYIHLIAITYTDVGYEDNAGAIIFPWLFEIYHPSMDIHLTAITYTDVGYEDNAGAIIFPWLLEAYRTSCTFVALCHPWHRDIPYILYIKKPAFDFSNAGFKIAQRSN
jgi:hypothetical protein